MRADLEVELANLTDLAHLGVLAVVLAVRDLWVRDVRDQTKLLGEVVLELLLLVIEDRQFGLQLLLRLQERLALLRPQLAKLLAAGLLFRTQRIDPRRHGAQFGVQRQGAVDSRRPVGHMFLDSPRARGVGVLA